MADMVIHTMMRVAKILVVFIYWEEADFSIYSRLG